MSKNYKILKNDLFLRTIKHNIDIEHIILLGAGASKSSGIQTAEECIWEWKKEIFKSNNIEDLDKYKISDWDSYHTKNIIQKWLDNCGIYPPNRDQKEYSFYAEESFLNSETRRNFFERICQGKNPSIGYKILCLLAKRGLVRIVLTTNFDGLFVKAAYQNDITPKEITIETANLIDQPIMGNTVLSVALHGDYKYSKLKNTEKELDNQSAKFKNALKFHLYNKHLIVIGYSGRDKSLMTSLKAAYSVNGSGSIFWCSYGDEVSEAVEDLISSISGGGRQAYLAYTNGFDKTLLDIARYCYSDDPEFRDELNKIHQIRNITTSDGEIPVESLSAYPAHPVAKPAPVKAVSIDTFVDKRNHKYDGYIFAELTTSCIVGYWKETNGFDKDIIGGLSKKHYSDWIINLRETLHHEDSPLNLTNGLWEVIDRVEFWKALSDRIFDDMLDSFLDSVVEVLTEEDPKFELPVEQRYAANIYGKVLKYSSNLRQGMAETLALLGNYSGALINCSQEKRDFTALLAIRKILGKADWRLWGSLNELLPTLAEAAPSEFLSSVETALLQKPCPFDELFAQEGDGITDRNHMTGLLWALESLAWHEEHLGKAALILAELGSHDPGGKWANRPVNSLITILLPWYPQTLAPIDKRIASIKAIRTDFPDIAWKVLLSVLPNQHQTSSGTYKPRWRNTLPEDWQPKVSNQEYWNQIGGYTELAVEMAFEDLYRLRELVRNLDNLPEPSFDAVLEHLSSTAVTGLSEVERLPIWTSVTEFVRKHRRHSGAKWALDAETVARIEATANKLTPTSPENLYRRIFSNRDFDLYEVKGNREEQHNRLDEKRQEAIREILEARGLQGVRDFINTVESPHQAGLALGSIANSEIDLYFLPSYLDNENIIHKQFLAGYIWNRYKDCTWHWVDGLDRTGWSPMQNSKLLIHLPFNAECWRRASEWLGKHENMYWQNVRANPFQAEDDLLLAIDNLLKVSRPQAAIDCLHYRLQEKSHLDIDRTVRALIGAASSKESAGNMDYYNVIELIKALQNNLETDQNDLFQVEWAYLHLLERHSDAEPKLLEKRLATQPEFFCEIIRLIYRSKNEEKREEPDEQKKAIASNAWQLLREWRRPPGLNEDGSFSASDFNAWLKGVKKECGESGHLEVALITIGGALVHCPPDPQGLWIMQTVAKALNARDVEEMRRGYSTGVRNSRGVHWVDPTGKPERELAEQWRKKANDVEGLGYARFAATLRELAESYDREAERVITSHERGGKTDEDKE